MSNGVDFLDSPQWLAGKLLVILTLIQPAEEARPKGMFFRHALQRKVMGSGSASSQAGLPRCASCLARRGPAEHKNLKATFLIFALGARN
jgi:hypothetical protein